MRGVVVSLILLLGWDGLDLILDKDKDTSLDWDVLFVCHEKGEMSVVGDGREEVGLPLLNVINKGSNPQMEVCLCKERSRFRLLGTHSRGGQ